MKVKELIEELQKYDSELEVCSAVHKMVGGENSIQVFPLTPPALYQDVLLISSLELKVGESK